VAEHVDWTRAVIKIGTGRGFVVAADHERFVITAAHCLPHFPPCMAFSGIEERTYAKLHRPIGGKRTVWGECVFVDPLADVAVLGTPDNQGFDKEVEAYDALVEVTFPLPIGDLPLTSSPITLPSSFTETTRAGKERITAPPCTILGPPGVEAEAWLLGLDGQWFRCQVRAGSRGLTILRAAETIAGGMSGSPIVLDNGTAIGVAVANAGASAPFLSRQLPARLLAELAAKE
jgi:hypothetical protein